jgi:predicted N-acetyltransferase YhbS
MSDPSAPSGPGGQRRATAEDVLVTVIRATEVVATQLDAVRQLQAACFGDVPADDLLEDYIAEPFARVLATDQGVLVGYVSIFVREVVYDGDPVRFGGLGGTCIRLQHRRRGIGTAVCRAGVVVLREAACDVAFLPAAPGTEPFYGRFGFVPVETPYTFVNVHGATKRPPATAGTAMLAPICSQRWFDRIRRGTSPLHLGPEPGYW